MRERLTEAVNNLPERKHLVITLYLYEEVSMKDSDLS
jgi:DNA-directed RNA polymerase specialized sigma subunit